MKKKNNFNWEEVYSVKEFGASYKEEEKKKIIKLYEEALNKIKEFEVVKGTVIEINKKDIILNINFKADGLISISEFKDIPNLKIGDVVDVYIEEQENKKGELILSRKKAKLVKGWEKIQNALNDNSIIDGIVKRRTKGGLIVNIDGIEAFLPGSQIDIKPIKDFDIFVEKKIEVKIIKIKHSNDNVVVSHKTLIEKDLEKQKIEIISNLEKGQILKGTIKNMTNFGVFIDLGGVDGLLHITDISWGRVNHPDELLELGQNVKVAVLDFDEEKKRISLGMKQLITHPWTNLSESVKVGSKVKGKIVNIADYGIFLEVIPGIEGLIHISEMSWSQHIKNPQNFIKIGEQVEAIVLTLDREERKMSLGIKQLTEDPWKRKDLTKKYAIGTKHKGIVKNMANFGAFIELEEGIDGLLHVSDLSWTKKIKKPSEILKLEESIETVVLEINTENKRLALGLKQLEEDPWNTFEEIFSIGSNHRCTITKKTDKGFMVEMPYGISGFVINRHLIKSSGQEPEIGETLDFQIIEISKSERKILLSHTATLATNKEKNKKPIYYKNLTNKKDKIEDTEESSI
jgi:small subunit ribosomal protein S1